MRIEEKVLHLPEGDFSASVTIFDHSDASDLFGIYQSWRSLCHLLNNVNARSVNLPEGLSETAFCIAKNVWRCTSNIKGANSSYDCYDFNSTRGNNRIQVKACSVLPDLTSFGPTSEWDRIFFVDFYRFGEWDGTFDIYEVNTDDINNYPVNASQTLLEQKLQGRRPRFSIYKGLIQHGRYISKETFQITEDGVIRL